MGVRTRSYGRHAWAAAAVLGLMILVTGCSDDGSFADAGSTSSIFNEADVKFAQTMIPHHEQAIEMADAILAKQGVPSEITESAQQIKDAQVPQVEAMRGFWRPGSSPYYRTTFERGP